jgi:hypothetical protein
MSTHLSVVRSLQATLANSQLRHRSPASGYLATPDELVLLFDDARGAVVHRAD